MHAESLWIVLMRHTITYMDFYEVIYAVKVIIFET
jgi:hypothetical protein